MGLSLNVGERFLGNVTVDRREMQRLPVGMLLVPATADRFRRPEVLQTCNNILPLLRTGPKRSALLLPTAADIQVLCPPVVVPVRIIRLAVWLEFCSIPLDLSADRGRTAFQNGCDFSETETL